MVAPSALARAPVQRQGTNRSPGLRHSARLTEVGVTEKFPVPPDSGIRRPFTLTRRLGAQPTRIHSRPEPRRRTVPPAGTVPS